MADGLFPAASAVASWRFAPCSPASPPWSAPIAYILWPRWPEPVAVDAPSMPIIVGGVTFNVPPAAIRVPMQRRPGTQPRLDLVFVWPSLAPPDPTVKGTPAAPLNVNDRIFVTVIGADSTLPPIERLKTIYPRYITIGHTATTRSRD